MLCFFALRQLAREKRCNWSNPTVTGKESRGRLVLNRLDDPVSEHAMPEWLACSSLPDLLESLHASTAKDDLAAGNASLVIIPRGGEAGGPARHQCGRRSELIVIADRSAVGTPSDEQLEVIADVREV